MAFSGTVQSGSFFDKLQDLGFQAAGTALDVVRSKNVKMPVAPAPQQSSFVPIQQSAAPALKPANGGLTTQMMVLIGVGAVVLVLLLKK